VADSDVGPWGLEVLLPCNGSAMSRRSTDLGTTLAFVFDGVQCTGILS